MQLHAEIPLLAFPLLVHLWVTLLVGVPGRTRHGNKRRIGNRARLER